MTRIIVADEGVATFARHQLDLMTRMLKGSLDFNEIMRVDQEVIDRGGFITVDRSSRPLYPHSVKTVLYPELETTGLSQFNAGALVLWLHDDQKTGVVTGNVIHEHLKSNVMLEGCLGLRDLEEIKKKGTSFFRRHFQGKVVFGWKSVVQFSDGHLNVPYLIGYGCEVGLNWDWLDNVWHSNDPALRFV